jgi:hypothetical protein
MTRIKKFSGFINTGLEPGVFVYDVREAVETAKCMVRHLHPAEAGC